MNKRFRKRVLAYILSCAIIMLNFDFLAITVLANETSFEFDDIESGYKTEGNSNEVHEDSGAEEIVAEDYEENKNDGLSDLNEEGSSLQEYEEKEEYSGDEAYIAYTSWSFSSDDFQTDANKENVTEYNGLKLEKAKADNEKYLYVEANGTVLIPVEGNSTVTITFQYGHRFYFEDYSDDIKEVVGEDVSDYTYDYTGEKGYVKITLIDAAYVTKIFVEPKTENELSDCVEERKDNTFSDTEDFIEEEAESDRNSEDTDIQDMGISETAAQETVAQEADAEESDITADDVENNVENNDENIDENGVVNDDENSIGSDTVILQNLNSEDDFAENDEKIKFDAINKTVELSDSRIAVMAANLAASKKQQWKVTVTYRPDENAERQELTEGVHYDVLLIEGNGISGEQKIVIQGTEIETDLGTFVGKSRVITYRLLSKQEKGTYKDITKAFRLKLNKQEVKNAIYNGTYITPAVEGFDSSVEEGIDYQLVYRNNVNAGKASVTVIGIGDNYYGSKTFTFKIKPANIKTVTLNSTNLKITPNDKGYSITAQDDNSDTLVYKGSPITFTDLSLKLEDNLTLRRGVDYTITYKNNIKPGKATATIKAVNNFSGSIKLNYMIERTDVTRADIEGLKEVPAEYTLKKGHQVLEIEVNGVKLKSGLDFKVDYNQIKDDIREGKVIPGYVGDIAIRGMGTYNDIGNAKLNIKVVPGSFHIKSGVVVNAEVLEKAGMNMKKCIAATKITDAGGTKPTADEIESITIESNTIITVVPKDKQRFNTTELSCHVAKKLTSVVKQKKLVKGDTSKEKKYDGVNKVTLTTSEIVDNYLEVKSGNKLAADDIIIVAYKNNHKTGTATVTIQAADESAYYGKMNVKFKIVTAAKPKLGSGMLDDSDTEPDTPGNEPEPPDAEPSEIKVKITVGNTELIATMEDNATTQAIIEQMPMTLPMMDLYGREMCYRYGAYALPTDDLRSDGYEIGDIAYWPPGGSLVILYKQNGEHFERQHLGHIDSGVEVFETTGDVDVTFELYQTESEEEKNMKMNIQIGDHVLTATLVQNSSTEALLEMLSEAPVTIEMNDYASMEKVGPFPHSLPRNDEQISTDAGDLILYQGNSFVIYYDTNSWNFTRLGKIDNVTKSELKEILGSGSVTVVLSLPAE